MSCGKSVVEVWHKKFATSVTIVVNDSVLEDLKSSNMGLWAKAGWHIIKKASPKFKEKMKLDKLAFFSLDDCEFKTICHPANHSAAT